MNSLPTQAKDLKPKLFLRRFRPQLVFTIILSLIVLTIGVIFVVVKPFILLALENGITPQFVWRAIADPSTPLKQTAGRVNILVLGIPGGTYEGKDLTDSMFIVSVQTLGVKKHAFLTLPRDIWSPTLRDKINSAYHYGEEKRQGGGLILAKSIASEVTGLPIHYAILIDFSHFTRLIDIVGGIDVWVERAFDDYDFPIAGRESDLCNGDIKYRCRYKHIHFDSGWVHMNGERALEFVRSRHADAEDEGTDYARSKRQQTAIVAIKEKFFNKRLYLDIETDRKLFRLYDQAIDTDLLISDLLYLIKLLQKQNLGSFTRIAIPAQIKNRDSHDLLVVGPASRYGDRWVLVPRDEDFSEIHAYINCALNAESCPPP